MVVEDTTAKGGTSRRAFAASRVSSLKAWSRSLRHALPACVGCQVRRFAQQTQGYHSSAACS